MGVRCDQQRDPGNPGVLYSEPVVLDDGQFWQSVNIFSCHNWDGGMLMAPWVRGQSCCQIVYNAQESPPTTKT